MQSKFFGAVDMGTNSFHLIIVKIESDGSFRVVDKEREVIRLGSVKGTEMNFITEEEIKKAVKILKSFRKLAKLYDAKIRAVATSAVRESKNREEFLNRVLSETGINVEVLEGHHEAKIIYKGALKGIEEENKKILCIDIGGGSTEFILGRNEEIFFAESIKIGAVRLSKKFFPDSLLSDSSIKECREYIRQQITSNKNLDFKASFDFAVGTSGTIQCAASMIYFKRNQYTTKSLSDVRFNSDELKNITDLILSKKTSKERLEITGLEEKRADIIPAGVLILQEAFDLFKINEMRISEYALREGVILDSIEKELNQEAS